MKKILLLSLVSVMAMAQEWEYLIYSTGMEFKNKKMTYVSVINENGKKVGVGKGDKDIDANADMLRKYLGKYNYKVAYELDVLSKLGAKEWELISVSGVGTSNKVYYFKRED